jgi:hypothetical protein
VCPTSGVQNGQRFGQRQTVRQGGRFVAGYDVGGRDIFQQQMVAMNGGA